MGRNEIKSVLKRSAPLLKHCVIQTIKHSPCAMNPILFRPRMNECIREYFNDLVVLFYWVINADITAYEDSILANIDTIKLYCTGTSSLRDNIHCD